MDYLGGPHLNTQVFKSRGSCIVEASESQSHVTGGESEIRKKQEGAICKSNIRCMILSDAEDDKLLVLLLTPDRGLPKAIVSCPFERWRLANLSFSPCTSPKDFFPGLITTPLLLCSAWMRLSGLQLWDGAESKMRWEVSLWSESPVTQICLLQGDVITAKEGKWQGTVVSETWRPGPNGHRIFISAWEDRLGKEVKM